MMFSKFKRIRNKAHLAFVRTLPCVKCFLEDQIEAHHLTLGVNNAMARKAGDDCCLSLCRKHHFFLHAHGEFSFWSGLPERALELAKKIFDITGNRDKAIELIKEASL